MPNMPELEIVLPVHNEAASIERVLGEIGTALAGRIRYRVIVCEDGSTDGTKGLLRELETSLPLKLCSSDARRGYSKAVLEGLREASSEWVLCLDSDGQCDITDLFRIWEQRHARDVWLGWRVRRQDPLFRRALSRTFQMLYRARFSIPVHDPSCPFVLVRRTVLSQFLDEIGLMQQGFWWEFVARAHVAGCHLGEFPIRHRNRFAGTTQVYRLRSLPRIALSHVAALYRIPQQTSAR